MKDRDRYFDLRGLSEYSCLSIRTLRNHLGKIPYYRLGGKLLVKKSEFDKFIEQHRAVDNLGEVVDEIMDEISTNN